MRFILFVSGFYLFALIVIRLDKIRGLERLKMCFHYSGIRIVMLLCCNKRGFVKVTRACVSMYVCMYIHIYSIIMCF